MTASRKFVVPVGLLALDIPPAGPNAIGDSYFDKVTGQVQTWDGTKWAHAATEEYVDSKMIVSDFGPTGTNYPVNTVWVEY